MKFIRFIFLLLLFFRLFSVSGQYYLAGQDPARYKWRQINTTNYRVIFPNQFEKEANRVANILEKAFSYIGSSLKHQPKKKYSIILHTASMTSNAFVGIAPSRSEFYSMPDQESLPIDWFEHLALHEGRHMVQIDKVKEEMPALLKVLFGEGITALCMGAYLPFWLIEGDAVCNETALSYSGRGRFPDFRKELRAQILEKGAYSYDKAYLGSFCDYTPSHYHLGYLLTAGSRELYGSELWSNVFQYVGSRPFSLNPLEKTLKQETGGGKIDLYKKIINQYKSRWELEDKSLALSPISFITKPTSFYSNYRYPQLMDDGSIIAYKTGLDEISRIVKISSDGKESNVFTPGNILPNCFSSDGKDIVWIESLPNARWSLSNRTLVRILKEGEHSTKNLVFNEKLLAPSISPDGNRLSVVSVDEKGINRIQILDIEDGAELHTFQTKNNDYFIGPSWCENGTELLTIAVNSNGKRILRINPENNSLRELVKPTYTEIRKPTERNENVYFIAGKTGIDNLYRLDPKNGNIDRLTSVRFGMDDPMIHNDELYFSNYTADGYQIAHTKLSDLKADECLSLKIQDDPTVNAISQQEPGVVDFTIDTIQYSSKPYRKGKHLFNFHSWLPTYWENEYSEFSPGVTFQSQNLLSTATTEVGVGYNPSEGTTKWKAGFKYYGFYPVLDFEISTGKEKELIDIDPQEGVSIVQNIWRETSLDLNVSIPLNLSFGAYYRSLTPKFTYELKKLSEKKYYSDESLHSCKYEIFGYNLLKQSQRDLFSKWGQVFRLNYIHSSGENMDREVVKSAEGWLYFPGFFKHHSFMLYSGIQQKEHEPENLISGNTVRFARGYTSYLNDELNTIGIDYRFPIFYPDMSLGKWLYIKRLKGGLFIDYSDFSFLGIYKKKNISYKASRISYGAELRMDFNPLRLMAPIDIGGRAIWLHEDQQMRWEFLLSININGF